MLCLTSVTTGVLSHRFPTPLFDLYSIWWFLLTYWGLGSQMSLVLSKTWCFCFSFSCLLLCRSLVEKGVKSSFCLFKMKSSLLTLINLAFWKTHFLSSPYFLPPPENLLTTIGREIAAFVSFKGNLIFLRERLEGLVREICLDPFLCSLH